MNLLNRSYIYCLVMSSAITICMENQNIKQQHQNAKRPKPFQNNAFPTSVRRRLSFNDENQKWKVENATDQNQKWAAESPSAEKQAVELITNLFLLLNQKNK